MRLLAEEDASERRRAEPGAVNDVAPRSDGGERREGLAWWSAAPSATSCASPSCLRSLSATEPLTEKTTRRGIAFLRGCCSVVEGDAEARSFRRSLREERAFTFFSPVERRTSSEKRSSSKESATPSPSVFSRFGDDSDSVADLRRSESSAH